MTLDVEPGSSRPRRIPGYRALLFLASLVVVASGCGHKSHPTRTTTVPIIGYPYPFGISVNSLLGKDPWLEDSTTCARYVRYQLRNPNQSSRWSAYTSVTITADSTGGLQGFTAMESFKNPDEAQKAMIDILSEIRRRYGAQTDSVRSEKTVHSRTWADARGNAVELSDRDNGVVVALAMSGRLKKDCPDAVRRDMQSH